eukprot:s3385_g1.t1
MAFELSGPGSSQPATEMPVDQAQPGRFSRASKFVVLQTVRGPNSKDGLTVGIQVIQRAFQRKVNSLEQEIKKMELTCEEHRASVANLDRKTSALQVELVESKERWEQLQDEEKELYKTLGSLKKQILRRKPEERGVKDFNHGPLGSSRPSCDSQICLLDSAMWLLPRYPSAYQLNHQADQAAPFTRLESLKAAVLKEIQDDQHKEAELGELKSLMSDEYFRGTMPLTAGELGYGPSREAPRFSPVTSGPQVFPSEPRGQGPRAPAASLPSYGGRSDDASIGSRPPVVDGKAFF